MLRDTTIGLTRRQALKAAGAAGFGLSVVGSTAAAASGSREGFEFRTVINMIDAGADPTGEEPIDDLLYELSDDHTLLQFPPGDYLLKQFRNYTGEFGSFDPEKYQNLTDFGMKGHNATLVVPEGTGRGEQTGFFEQVWLDLRYMNGTLLEGFTFDNTATNTGGTVTVGPYDRGVVRDIDIDGIYDGEFSPFIFWVPEKEDGFCLVQDVRIPEGYPYEARYETAEPGFFVFIDHRGVLEIRDCLIRGCSNGIYQSTPSHGGVQVEGGYYAHNEVAQVRVHGPRSHIKNVHMAIEDIAEKHPNFRNQRAIWVWRRKGLDIKNCTIDMVSPTSSQGAIVIRRAAGETTIENTDIRVDADGIPAIWAKTPLESDGPFGYGPAPPVGEREIDMKNVRITGEAAGGQTVLIEDRDGNEFKNCRIEQTGPNRDGLVFHNSDATVRNTFINVTGEPLVAVNSDIETRNVR